MEERQRNILFYKNYFEDFFLQQRQKVKDKILWTLTLIEEIEIVPENYLKHLTGTEGSYGIRVQMGSDILESFVFLIREILSF